MFKMGLHIPFEYLKHKLWSKEGLRVKMPIWLPTTKSHESFWFSYVHVVCHILLESSGQGLQIFFKSHLNQRSKNEVMAFQNHESQFREFWDFQLGSPNTKWHLGVGPMARHWEYYKGKGGGFPQVQAMVSLVNLCMPVVCPCTKNAPAMH
jgi:hypothetical protein